MDQIRRNLSDAEEKSKKAEQQRLADEKLHQQQQEEQQEAERQRKQAEYNKCVERNKAILEKSGIIHFFEELKDSGILRKNIITQEIPTYNFFGRKTGVISKKIETKPEIEFDDYCYRNTGIACAKLIFNGDDSKYSYAFHSYDYIEAKIAEDGILKINGMPVEDNLIELITKAIQNPFEVRSHPSGGGICGDH